MKNYLPRFLVGLSLLLLLSIALNQSSHVRAAAGDNDWLPVDPAYLTMKTPVVEADADAEALFWEVRVADEVEGGTPRTVLRHYVRIKIFTERGRESQSRVDILAPKVQGRETKIKDIAGRTIKPDGTIVELKKDDIFERTIVKASGFKVKAKSFVMPSVEPGAIIEYRWREIRGDTISFYDRLELARDIPVQLVKYYIKPLSLPDFPYGMRAQPFNANTPPFQKEKNGFYSTQLTNVPAFREEPRMIPEYAVRPWILVYYADDKKRTPQQMWKEYAKELYDEHKSQMKVNDDVKRAAAEAIAGATTDDEKLDRIFTYVRSKVKNVHDAASGFTSEQIEKMKDNKSPADTLKRGVGNWHDIDMLFAALATAAGFEARVAKVANRSDIFFDPAFADTYFMRIGSENIAVRVGDRWRFYDPGSTYITQGMLPWQEEGQSALIADPKEPLFVTTPVSGPDKSLERRTGKFRLSEDGTLEGEVRIEYTGHLSADMKVRNEDDSPAEREETIREKFKSRLGSIELSDIKVENATDPDKPFAYSFRIKVPGYAQRTGKRLFFQPAFFQRNVAPLFPTSQRRHDLYFYYPWGEEDTVEFTLPEGFALDNAEAPAEFASGTMSRYAPKVQFTKDGRTLIYTRKFHFDPRNGEALVVFPSASYHQVKRYFDEVHKQDNHSLALRQGTTASTSSN